MKIVILIAILGVIGFFAFRGLYKSLTGKGGCSCSSSKKTKCPIKKECKK